MRAFIDSDGHKYAAPYFKMFPHEPLAGSGMADISSIEEIRPWSLDRLLTAIARVPPGSNIMIVSHGTGGGLLIPIGGFRGGLSRETINALRRVERGELKDSEIGMVLGGLTPATVHSLITLAQRVRSLKLGTIVFRACMLGSYPDVLEALRGFFGATAVCAPTLMDFFGVADPGSLTTDQTTWTVWQQQHPWGVVSGEKGNRFALEIRNGRVAAIADTASAITSWVRQYLPPGNYQKGRFYLHAFESGDTYLFPMQNKYREQLRRQP